MTVDSDILHWELTQVSSGRDAYYANHPDGGLYYIVWESPCWCLRYEPGPTEKIRWMGQFVEPNGLRAAKSRAQADCDRTARRRAWEKYMLENDPPIAGGTDGPVHPS